MKGKMNKAKKTQQMAKTPPVLLGMLHKIQ
jgi:hypothetical protein